MHAIDLARPIAAAAVAGLFIAWGMANHGTFDRVMGFICTTASVLGALFLVGAI